MILFGKENHDRIADDGDIYIIHKQPKKGLLGD